MRFYVEPTPAGGLALFERLGSMEVIDRQGGVMEIDVQLPAERKALGEALRGAAEDTSP